MGTSPDLAYAWKVLGMTCIKPCAPAGDTALGSKPDSALATAWASAGFTPCCLAILLTRPCSPDVSLLDPPRAAKPSVSPDDSPIPLSAPRPPLLPPIPPI